MNPYTIADRWIHQIKSFGVHTKYDPLASDTEYVSKSKTIILENKRELIWFGHEIGHALHDFAKQGDGTLRSTWEDILQSEMIAMAYGFYLAGQGSPKECIRKAYVWLHEVFIKYCKQHDLPKGPCSSWKNARLIWFYEFDCEKENYQAIMRSFFLLSNNFHTIQLQKLLY